MMNKKSGIIGYTTGVFDLFHIGHLNLLKKSSLLCNKLIVGVYSDDIVMSYKGILPIIPHNERMAVISALKFVYKVVSPENRDDKLAQWKHYGFDIYFIGSDWQGTKRWIHIENEFNTVGIKIIYIPYTSSISSSAIKKKIISRAE